ncbi:MAG: hypothetical protein WBA57_17265 [Elainellaceae cyanobacterium]
MGPWNERWRSPLQSFGLLLDEPRSSFLRSECPKLNSVPEGLNDSTENFTGLCSDSGKPIQVFQEMFTLHSQSAHNQPTES